MKNIDPSGGITTAISTLTGAATALDKDKPHVKTDYGNGTYFVYCPEEGVPYMLIMNKPTTFSLSCKNSNDAGGTNLDLYSASQVASVVWAGGKVRNIANNIGNGELFSLTIIRMGTTLYCACSLMDSN